MRKYFLGGILIVATVIISACSGGYAQYEKMPAEPQDSYAKKSASLKTAVLDVEGMTCPSCAAVLKYQLEEVGGVISAEVDYAEGRAEVVFDDNKVSAESIAQASTVYPAKVVSVS